MGLIRVVWGAATAPTEMAAYDAALAEANVHDYNIVTVSSVIPAAADVEVVGTAPDLGPVGERLTVVEARATAGPDDDTPAIAGLGWSVASEGTGIFYEASGPDRETVERTIDDGLAAGRALRDWDWQDGGRRYVTTDTDTDTDADAGADAEADATADADTGAYACAVVLAVYGESAPLV